MKQFVKVILRKNLVTHCSCHTSPCFAVGGGGGGDIWGDEVNKLGRQHLGRISGSRSPDVKCTVMHNSVMHSCIFWLSPGFVEITFLRSSVF